MSQPSFATWQTLHVETITPVGYTDVTPLLAEQVSGLTGDGILSLFVPHTTCALILNSGVDGATLTDIRLFIERSVPVDTPFVHTVDTPQDAAAHLRILFGLTSLQVPFSHGHLALGHAQGIYLLELDGPRARSIMYAAQEFRA